MRFIRQTQHRNECQEISAGETRCHHQVCDACRRSSSKVNTFKDSCSWGISLDSSILPSQFRIFISRFFDIRPVTTKSANEPSLLRRYLPIVFLAVVHALVDAVANFVEPLWPELRAQRSLSERDVFLLLALTSVAPNFSQLVFGFIRDRFGARYLLWLGPILGALCMSTFGLVDSTVGLGLVLALGYVGIGGFHPEAVVCAGTLLPEQRTRALSIFMFGGNLGLAMGPAISGIIVNNANINALAWLAVPISGLMLALYWFGRFGTYRPAHSAAHIPHASHRTLRGNWKLSVFLLLICSLRVVPAIGMNRALAFTLEPRGFGPDGIGMIQSVFLFSGSIGILLVGSCFGRGEERRLLISTAWIGVFPMIGLAIPTCPTWLLVALLVPAGIILNGTTPAMISYAHQLFPREAGMASALTMGLSYGTSGLAVAGLVAVLVDQFQQPQWLFATFIPPLVAAAIGAAFLPRIILPTSPQSGT
jgi:FSR family fosmidomycin resistance protein-like MFS transporter